MAGIGKEKGTWQDSQSKVHVEPGLPPFIRQREHILCDVALCRESGADPRLHVLKTTEKGKALPLRQAGELKPEEVIPMDGDERFTDFLIASEKSTPAPITTEAKD